MIWIPKTYCFLWIIWGLGFLFEGEGVDLDYPHITISPEHIIWPLKKQEGTVIFLHGMTEIGTGIDNLVKMVKKYQLEIPHLKIVFPTAPLRPYSLMGYASRHVWFDQKQITPYGEENAESMEDSLHDLKLMIQREIDSGVPVNKIIIGGFSMGGEIAMHLGYRFRRDVGGVFAFAACLNKESVVYKLIEEEDIYVLPETYMAQGCRDDVILIKWAQESLEKMQEYGIRAEMDCFKELGHEVTYDQFNELWYWVLQRIPDVYGPTKQKKFVLK